MEEELFCLKFELDAMSALFIKGEAERWVHGFNDLSTETQHIDRYKLALKYVEQKKVLDIAGGSGYGTYFMAKHGNPVSIDSVDLDSDAVRYANHRYEDKKISRWVGNAETYVQKNKYDIIVSFETIEHLSNYAAFLSNIHASLGENGRLIISTPINIQTTTDCINPYHKIEWAFDDFHNLIDPYFTIENIFLQNVVLQKDLKFRRLKNILKRLFQIPLKGRPSFEKYTNQYNRKEIIGGFQTLVCIKRK